MTRCHHDYQSYGYRSHEFQPVKVVAVLENGAFLSERLYARRGSETKSPVLEADATLAAINVTP